MQNFDQETLNVIAFALKDVLKSMRSKKDYTPNTKTEDELVDALRGVNKHREFKF